MEPLDGIAAADAHLGGAVPLPRAPLPLVRWVDVVAVGPGAVEVAWSLDDSRDGAPGRLALYAGRTAPGEREVDGFSPLREVAPGVRHRAAPLEQAQPSLRPVQELHWERGGLHLRLTAQGPWSLEELLTVASSVE